MNPTITMCITDACNLNCSKTSEGYNCIAGAKNHGMDTKAMLDIHQALEWRKKFFPNSPVHISGGEPFLHPNIKEGILECVSQKIDTTVFSNGTLLSSNSWCYDLSLKWCLTYHRQVSLKRFLENISPLKDKSIICQVFTTKRPEETKYFDDFNYMPIKANSGYYSFEDIKVENNCPNYGILLIGTKGEIFSCSNPYRQYGNVNDMTFDIEEAKKLKCHSNKYPNKCHTMQNAYLFSKMKG